MSGSSQGTKIIDGSSDVKATITERGLKTAVGVEILDASGDQVTDFGTTSVTTPTLYNVAMSTEGTEYSQALPDNTRKLLIKLRGASATLRFGFASGATTATYATIPTGSSFYVEGVNLTDVTVYLLSTTAAQVAEIICWT